MGRAGSGGKLVGPPHLRDLRRQSDDAYRPTEQSIPSKGAINFSRGATPPAMFYGPNSGVQ
jgi:hypothetical protein